MSNPPTNTRIPWILALPFLVILGIWLMPGKDARHEETLDALAVLPDGVKTVRLVVGKGNVDVVLGSPGKVSWKGRSLQVARHENAETQASILAQVRQAPLRLTSTVVGAEMLLTATPLPAEVDALHCLRQMNLVLRMPVDINLKIEAEAGDIGVKQRNAAIDIRLGELGGKVMLADNSGAVHVITKNKDVIVDRHRGPLTATTTEEGKLIVSLVDVVAPVTLTNVAGAVTCKAPKTASFEVDMRCAGKDGITRVVRSFGIDPQEHPDGSKTLVGKVRDGGPLIKVRSESGTLVLLPIE